MRYDCLIIGSGAGGGTLAYKLAKTGKHVLLIEQGDFIPREKANWDPNEVFLKHRYKTKETYTDINGKKFHPGTSYCVGGNTKFFGGSLIRFRSQDFEGMRHKDGTAPDWPLKYKDFQPWYLEAEQLYQVHGKRGADPTEPQETVPYPYPEVSFEPRTKKLADGFKALGVNPFPLPLGIRLNEKDRKSSACIRCDTCDGYPCLVDAKSDAEVSCIRLALQLPNFTLLTRAKALLLETDLSGKSIKSVKVDVNGKIENLVANAYVLSCGAINSSLLLLRSANDRHPRGIGNSSDLVGRNYMSHVCTVILGVSRVRHTDNYVKTFGINDFYFNASDWDFPLGHVQMMGNVKKEMLRSSALFFIPDRILARMAEHGLAMFVCSEDLPVPENRVMVGASSETLLHYKTNNYESHMHLVKKTKKMLRSIEFGIYLTKWMGIEGVGHQCGTCRFGHDPKISVLDSDCKMHDLENLYVVDSSFFPSSAAVNPALTIIANALRVGDHLSKIL